MTDLVIPDGKLTRKLREYACRENRSVEEVLESLLEKYAEPDSEEAKPKPGSFAALAESALRANIGSGKRVDTSARSREITRAEFADHIRRKMDKPEPDADNSDSATDTP